MSCISYTWIADNSAMDIDFSIIFTFFHINITKIMDIEVQHEFL